MGVFSAGVDPKAGDLCKLEHPRDGCHEAGQLPSSSSSPRVHISFVKSEKPREEGRKKQVHMAKMKPRGPKLDPVVCFFSDCLTESFVNRLFFVGCLFYCCFTNRLRLFFFFLSCRDTAATN